MKRKLSELWSSVTALSLTSPPRERPPRPAWEVFGLPLEGKRLMVRLLYFLGAMFYAWARASDQWIVVFREELEAADREYRNELQPGPAISGGE